MNRLFTFMNWLTDMDWGWWPVLHCRPARDRDIDFRVLLKVTPLFGSVAGILIVAASPHLRTPIGMAACITSSWVMFFVLYRITFAMAWNRRAKELRKAPPDIPAHDGQEMGAVEDSGAARRKAQGGK